MGLFNRDSNDNQDKKPKKVIITFSSYLGGHNNLGKKRKGNLVLTSEEMGMSNGRSPSHAVLKWTEIENIDIGGGQVGKNKVGAEIMFGVLGGLGAKSTKNQTDITVYTTDKQMAYYQIDKKSPLESRAIFAPFLQSAGIKFHDEASQEAQNDLLREAVKPSSGDANNLSQLEKLADLKNKGIITQAEFDKKKAQILGL